ncbi:MAG: hypothetical protein P4L03_01105 [Terracidiphilus sp.]|nr:hypothetical protein [Terracidiphilus sp.]
MEEDELEPDDEVGSEDQQFAATKEGPKQTRGLAGTISSPETSQTGEKSFEQKKDSGRKQNAAGRKEEIEGEMRNEQKEAKEQEKANSGHVRRLSILREHRKPLQRRDMMRARA